nr:hypothetical protein Iba_chr07dCG9780 [Ipomoea batatas]
MDMEDLEQHDEKSLFVSQESFGDMVKRGLYRKKELSVGSNSKEAWDALAKKYPKPTELVDEPDQKEKLCPDWIHTCDIKLNTTGLWRLTEIGKESGDIKNNRLWALRKGWLNFERHRFHAQPQAGNPKCGVSQSPDDASSRLILMKNVTDLPAVGHHSSHFAGKWSHTVRFELMENRFKAQLQVVNPSVGNIIDQRIVDKAIDDRALHGYICPAFGNMSFLQGGNRWPLMCLMATNLITNEWCVRRASQERNVEEELRRNLSYRPTANASDSKKKAGKCRFPEEKNYWKTSREKSVPSSTAKGY